MTLDTAHAAANAVFAPVHNGTMAEPWLLSGHGPERELRRANASMVTSQRNSVDPLSSVLQPAAPTLPALAFSIEFV
ncbi:MAG: hypothetical protein GTN62_07330 [Gemmatimonadales bacterium]|nr:hypothetical protein [Gemmatimonadales bacterium]NIN11312.1 hypothetical protein [Gemmatimonadales bacterium]NIN49911.1 hypothetical protein [Gemmatimonadales bacterium]NIP07375.1 hypothetical protein [Gemmatimonadales bacterium]NIR03070.1 hypothetical protein [Gemmatimonadales bacterium]